MPLTCGFIGDSTEPYGVSAGQSMISCVRGASRRLRTCQRSLVSWHSERDESAATSEGEDLAAAMDAIQNAAAPEVQLAAQVANFLDSARDYADQAFRLLAAGQEMGLRPEGVANLRALLMTLAGTTSSVSKVIDRIESHGG